jgi:hypothetical protein
MLRISSRLDSRLKRSNVVRDLSHCASSDADTYSPVGTAGFADIRFIDHAKTTVRNASRGRRDLIQRLAKVEFAGASPNLVAVKKHVTPIDRLITA